MGTVPDVARDLNYYDTFIAVAEDCPRTSGTAPGEGAAPSVAAAQYALVADAPYVHDQNDVLYAASVRGGALDDLDDEARAAARDAWFARPQACFRASPLAKTHGWGVHADARGRIALYGVGTEEYDRLAADPGLRQLRAMRSRRA